MRPVFRLALLLLCDLPVNRIKPASVLRISLVEAIIALLALGFVLNSLSHAVMKHSQALESSGPDPVRTETVLQVQPHFPSS